MQSRVYGMNETVINDVLPVLIPVIAQKNTALLAPAPVVDIFSALGGTKNLSKNISTQSGCTVKDTRPMCKYFCDQQSCDQCHPNDAGYAVVAKTVALAVRRK